jgi:Ran GTPase-activating protein (RanGAP) involved in mRNA processing and transport
MLESNDIGVDGVKAIFDSLKQSTSMRELNLDFNSLGEEGGLVIASQINNVTAPNDMKDKSALELLKAVITQPGKHKLEELKLHYNDISDTAGESICLIMESLKTPKDPKA